MPRPTGPRPNETGAGVREVIRPQLLREVADDEGHAGLQQGHARVECLFWPPLNPKPETLNP